MIDKNINDLQCWVFRHAQTKWRMSSAECSDLFAKYEILDFIEQCYEVLHVSSYGNALSEVEQLLKNRGVKV